MRRLIHLAARVLVPLACVVALVVFFRPNAIAHVHVAIALAFALLAGSIAVQTRGVVQNVLLMVTTLCVAFAGLEGFFELREPNVELVTPGMWRLDADLGAVAATTGPREVREAIDGKTIYRATYTLDERLRRATKSALDAPRARFFGDSFTFGVGIDDAQTLPQAFADLTGMNVENYGYPGYSPAQALYAMQKGLFDADIAQAQLFVLQTANFHVDRIACLPQWTEGAPHYVLVAGKLRLDGHCASHPWQSLASYRALLAPLVERPSRADVETWVAVVEAIADLARTKYKVPLVILDMERDEPTYLRRQGLSSAEIDKRFRATGAIVVADDATSPPLATLRIPGDGHPNGAANLLLARKLAAAVARDTDVKLPRRLSDSVQAADPK